MTAAKLPGTMTLEQARRELASYDERMQAVARWRDRKTAEEKEMYVLSVMRLTNPDLTLEKFREGHARFREKERIRKQEEAARRKAKRDAKKEQGA